MGVYKLQRTIVIFVVKGRSIRIVKLVVRGLPMAATTRENAIRSFFSRTITKGHISILYPQLKVRRNTDASANFKKKKFCDEQSKNRLNFDSVDRKEICST